MGDNAEAMKVSYTSRIEELSRISSDSRCHVILGFVFNTKLISYCTWLVTEGISDSQFYDADARSSRWLAGRRC